MPSCTCAQSKTETLFFLQGWTLINKRLAVVKLWQVWHRPETGNVCLQSISCAFWNSLTAEITFFEFHCHLAWSLLVFVENISIFHENYITAAICQRLKYSQESFWCSTIFVADFSGCQKPLATGWWVVSGSHWNQPQSLRQRVSHTFNLTFYQSSLACLRFENNPHLSYIGLNSLTVCNSDSLAPPLYTNFLLIGHPL